MTTGEIIALTRQYFVGKVMSLLFNMLPRLVIVFLPRSKHPLISWLWSPCAVILEPQKNKVCQFPLFPHIFATHDFTLSLILLPCLGYCKQCCCEHRGACIFSHYSFVWIYAQENRWGNGERLYILGFQNHCRW